MKLLQFLFPFKRWGYWVPKNSGYGPELMGRRTGIKTQTILVQSMYEWLCIQLLLSIGSQRTLMDLGPWKALACAGGASLKGNKSWRSASGCCFLSFIPWPHLSILPWPWEQGDTSGSLEVSSGLPGLIVMVVLNMHCVPLLICSSPRLLKSKSYLCFQHKSRGLALLSWEYTWWQPVCV